MPDRIVRASILSSDRVNLLTWGAEVFYRRLMSVADDFGRFDGRTAILRAQLFALKLDRVTESDVGKWIRECDEAGLVRIYSVEEKPYLEILRFEQRTRAERSKFPDPPSSAGICQQMTADRGHPRTYSYSKSYSDSSSAPAAKPAERKRDVLFDALAIAEGSDPKQLTAPAAKKIGVALAAIRAVAPSLAPSDIQARARAYRRVFPTAALTAHALAAHWAKCGGSDVAKQLPPIPEPTGWKAHINHEMPDCRYSAGSTHAQAKEAHEWSDIERTDQQLITSDMQKKGLL